MFATLRGHTIYTPPLTSGPVVLDLGANRGAFSRSLHAWYGGTYHMVEANPALAAGLPAEGPFSVRNYAVSGEDGTLTFNIANNDEGSSILALPEQSTKNCTLRDVVEVPSRRLDHLIAEFGLDRVDLIKMDIEGAEGAAIASLPDASLESIGQITVEFHCDPAFGYDLTREVQETIARLESLGFLALDFSLEETLGDVLLLNRKYVGIAGSRAAALRALYLEHKWARRFWHRLPEPVKDAARRVVRGKQFAGR